MIIFWLIFSCLAFAAGECFSKFWATHGQAYWIALMVLAYAVADFAWLPIIKQRNELAVMGSVWLVVATVSTVILGTVFFREQLSLAQYICIAVAVVAMAIMPCLHN